MLTMPIRLIAIDVDGTLLRPDKTLSPRVVAAVAEASKRVPVVLASARPPRSLRAIHEALDLRTAQVNYNGAYVWDRVNTRSLSHSPMSPALVIELIDAARAHSPEVLVSIEDQDRWLTDRIDDRFLTETARLFGPDVVAPLQTFEHLGATKLMLQAQSRDITRLRPLLEARFADRVTFIRTDEDLLQIMDRHTTKCRTLTWLAREMGVSAAEIMTIGDNENDIEMIREAGLGVAMANGTPDALVAARWIAPSNVDDGVAVAIERFVLSPAPDFLDLAPQRS